MERAGDERTGYRSLSRRNSHIRQLRIFVDRSSIEAFDSEGKMVMTNLVFPTEPYDRLVVKGKAKAKIYKITTK